MSVNEKFETKNAIFYSDKIVLKKSKGDITIEMQEIERLNYTIPTLENYILASGEMYPGRLAIWLKPPHEGKKPRYFIKMKNIDFLSLPFELKRRVDYKTHC